MDLFDAFYREHQAIKAGAAAARSQQMAENAADATRALQERVDRLTLINMAMWSLLKERTGLTEEDLVKKVQEIDMADGRADGRVHAVAVECPRCERTLSRKHNRCLFCGYEPENPDPFHPVR